MNRGRSSAAFGRWCFSALFGVLLCTHVAVAQNGTGRIAGRVVKDGAGVGAVVALVNELKLTQVTDTGGNFNFDAIPAGTYTLILSLGNDTFTRAVLVIAGQTTQLEIPVDWHIGVREEVVVTAAARAAKIVDAPAAVTAIAEEQIEQQASTGQVPKILEFTPGAEVTQSGLYDFNFNTRGFNSSLNRRVSTYIDGRDVGVVLLGAQEWAAIAGGLDDIASLEFIRGPSAALYGANASSGVVNITTKAPRDSLGTLVRLTSGELATLGVDFRRADSLGHNWYSKVMVGFKQSGDFTISRNPDGPDQVPETSDDLATPEYSTFCLRVGEEGCLPKERTLFREQDNEIGYGALRLDKYLSDESLLTFEAGLSDIAGPVFLTGIGRVQNLSSQRPFYRVNYVAPHWSVLGHYTSRVGEQANLNQALIVNYELDTDDQRYGVEAQGHWAFAEDKVRFVIGAAHTEERVDTADPDTGLQTVVFEPIDSNRQAVFSQVDWQATERFKFVFAGRVDKSTLHDTQFSPKAAMVYSINSKNSLRFTYNEAFQVANYSEYFLHAKIAFFPIGGFVRTICEGPLLPPPGVDCGFGGADFIPILAVGNDDLELETTEAWEVGYSGIWADKLFVTVDYYNSKNDNFITDLSPQVGTILGNLDGCIPEPILPGDDPNADPRTRCPINNDYLPWVGPEEAETTCLIPNLPPGTPCPLTVAQALRNSVQQSVGNLPLGFRLAQDLDGSSVVIGRTYTNVGQVDTQGVDLGVQYFVTRDLNLQFSYSWFDFTVVDADEALANILLPNSPEHKASVSLAYSKERWSASLGARWVEGFPWSAGIFIGFVPSYYTVDIGGSYAINDTLRVGAGVNAANATSNVHYEAFGGDLLTRRALLNMTFAW